LLGRGGALALAGCAVLALAGGLFLVRSAEAGPATTAVRVCLVDASASVARAPDWLSWVRGVLRDEARIAGQLGEELVVIVHGDGAAVGFRRGAPEDFRVRLDGGRETPFDPRTLVGDGATDLAAATTIAEGLLAGAEKAPGTVVLVGPGTFTGEDPGAALARLERGGHGLRHRPPPVAHVADLGVRTLELPRRVEVGAPLVARAQLSFDPGPAPGGGRAHATLEVRSGPTRELRELEVPLPTAAGLFELPVDCGPAGFGRTEIELRLALDGGDALPENDRASAWTVAEGARVVLVVAAPAALADARRWLAPGGTAPAGLELVFAPLGDELAALGRADALVTYDVPLGELSAPLVEAFVRAGGGWLATAGPRFLGDWTPGRPGPLHPLLPLAPAEAEHGPRDVLLLVDGSGSMEGEPFETVRAAALDLVGAALEGDRVVLRFFTTGLGGEKLLKERGAAAGGLVARELARERLGLQVPHGSTFLLRALGQLVDLLGGETDTETLVFLLTDGHDREALPDPLALASDRRRALLARGARLVVIAVGDADSDLLGRLADGPAGVRTGDSLGELSEIFQREVLGSRLAVGDALELEPVPRPPGSLAAEALGLRAEGERLLPLRRYVRCRLVPGAEILWQGGELDPVLAIRRVGLGRTALLATRPSPDWAPGWTGRAGPEEPREVVGLLRWLARRPGEAAGPRARIEDGRLIVEGLPPDAPARLPVRLREAQGAELGRVDAWPLTRPGSEVLTTREADLPAAWATGQRLLELELPGGLLPLLAQGALPPEFAGKERVLGSELLRERPAQPVRPPTVGGGHPAAAWVLAVGLGMLFAGAMGAGKGGHQGPGGNDR
jgi:hypothetical protein